MNEKYPDIHRVIVAAGLSRIYRHMSEGSFGILSAYRSNLSVWDNRARDAELKALVNEQGLGYMPAEGIWEGVSEGSVFIPNISRDAVQALAARYEQDAYIHGEGGLYQVVSTKDGTVLASGEVASKFHHIQEVETPEPQGYTKIKKWKFSLGSRDQMEVTVDEKSQGDCYFYRKSFSMTWPRFGLVRPAKVEGGYFIWPNGDRVPLRFLDVLLPIKVV